MYRIADGVLYYHAITNGKIYSRPLIPEIDRIFNTMRLVSWRDGCKRFGKIIYENLNRHIRKVKRLSGIMAKCRISMQRANRSRIRHTHRRNMNGTCANARNTTNNRKRSRHDGANALNT